MSAVLVYREGCSARYNIPTLCSLEVYILSEFSTVYEAKIWSEL